MPGGADLVPGVLSAIVLVHQQYVHFRIFRMHTTGEPACQYLDMSYLCHTTIRTTIIVVLACSCIEKEKNLQKEQ